MDIQKELRAVGLDPASFAEGDLVLRTPVDGTETGRLRSGDTAALADAAVARAHRAFLAWRAVPPPRRGELVRLFGEELRASKDALAALVSFDAC
jgi:aldehyde dehydrogenase (NAD+)